MNTASLKSLGLAFADGATLFCHRNHNRIVTPGSRQNVFSYAPAPMMLLVALRAVNVSGKVLVDLEVFPEEMDSKHVGKIGVRRDVVAHSRGLGFLAGYQDWEEKYRQEIPMVGVGVAVDIAGLDLGLGGGTHARKETGQRTTGIDCCTVLHLVS
jgi:hypothetical protein